MPAESVSSQNDKNDRLRAELRRDIELRQQSYRGQALKLFPHRCMRCGREFSGKRLRELTVHHKDCNYDNNPPDGSNWEMLCIYCHDDEHAVKSVKKMGDGPLLGGGRSLSPMAQPFEGLDGLIGKQEKK